MNFLFLKFIFFPPESRPNVKAYDVHPEKAQNYSNVDHVAAEHTQQVFRIKNSVSELHNRQERVHDNQAQDETH